MISMGTASLVPMNVSLAQDSLNRRLGGTAMLLRSGLVPAEPSGDVVGAGSTENAVALLGIVAAFVLTIVVVAKVLDLKRKRETEAALLQAQVSDALLRDARFGELSVTPTARVPLWSGSPATIELAGWVPTPDLHEAVLRLARSEATRVRHDLIIEDRVAVVSTRHVWAA
jgi:hypothetical protein